MSYAQNTIEFEPSVFLNWILQLLVTSKQVRLSLAQTAAKVKRKLLSHFVYLILSCKANIADIYAANTRNIFLVVC